MLFIRHCCHLRLPLVEDPDLQTQVKFISTTQTDLFLKKVWTLTPTEGGHVVTHCQARFIEM